MIYLYGFGGPPTQGLSANFGGLDRVQADRKSGGEGKRGELGGRRNL